MRIQHYDRSHGDVLFSRSVGFEELLRTSDIVSVHLPLTSETTGVIGAAELAMMKSTATLVNAARGEIVDEAALLAALRSGDLRSTGLDVIEAALLFSAPNLLL